MTSRHFTPLAFLLLITDATHFDTSTTRGAESFGEDRGRGSVS